MTAATVDTRDRLQRACVAVAAAQREMDACADETDDPIPGTVQAADMLAQVADHLAVAMMAAGTPENAAATRVGAGKGWYGR